MKIEIKDEYFKKLKSKIEGTTFKSVEEYIDYLLGQIVLEGYDEKERGEIYSDVEEDIYREKLKELGYE